MDSPMKMEGEMPTAGAQPPQTRFTVAASVSAAAPPVEIEPIAADEVEQEQRRINRQNKKRERDLKFLQEVTGGAELTMVKRRREQQDGPATQQTRQLVSNVSNLLDEKERLSKQEQQLVKRLAQAGIDAQLEVERLQSKAAVLDQVVSRAEGV